MAARSFKGILPESRYEIDPETGCWNWTGNLLKSGYGRILKGHKTTRAHRYFYEMHNGPIPNGEMICHRCDSPRCVNPAHLFAGMHADNMRDLSEKGLRHGTFTGHVGEKMTHTKLTDEQAISALADARTHAAIAADFGVSRSTISMLKSGRNWQWLNR